MSASAVTTVTLRTFATAAELHERLGFIPLERIRVVPPAGLATEEDLLRVLDHEDRICELIDGVLVEKTMGYYESMLAVSLIMALGKFVKEHDLGIVLGEAGTLRILEDQIRVPDVAFLSWRHFPGRVLPAEPVPAIAPDLAVEVLSAGNTPAEMTRKLKDYFAAGVKLVWFIDPASESATVYKDLRTSRKLSLADSLEGGEVLPGFELPLKEVFAEAGRRSGGQK
jgi:Uma2 family endonuclease